MPVLIALAHDLLITAGVYALVDREVTTSTVAALLTILGYSLYDTIIVFDRIRENVPRMPRATFSQIVNRSMSEVLTRSLATSFVALMPVGALMLFGGETLQDFAFALLVGVASGAYSSIFIATPVLVEWKEREPIYMRRRRLVMEEHGGARAGLRHGHDRRGACGRRGGRRRRSSPRSPRPSNTATRGASSRRGRGQAAGHGSGSRTPGARGAAGLGRGRGAAGRGACGPGGRGGFEAAAAEEDAEQRGGGGCRAGGGGGCGAGGGGGCGARGGGGCGAGGGGGCEARGGGGCGARGGGGCGTRSREGRAAATRAVGAWT